MEIKVKKEIETINERESERMGRKRKRELTEVELNGSYGFLAHTNNPIKTKKL